MGRGEAYTGFWVLVAKPEGKKPFGRPRRKWDDTIKIYIKIGMWGHVLDLSGSG
jgi:hypothetical protein